MAVINNTPQHTNQSQIDQTKITKLTKPILYKPNQDKTGQDTLTNGSAATSLLDSTPYTAPHNATPHDTTPRYTELYLFTI